MVCGPLVVPIVEVVLVASLEAVLVTIICVDAELGKTWPGEVSCVANVEAACEGFTLLAVESVAAVLLKYPHVLPAVPRWKGGTVVALSSPRTSASVVVANVVDAVVERLELSDAVSRTSFVTLQMRLALSVVGWVNLS